MKLNTERDTSPDRGEDRLQEALRKIERLEGENDDLRASLGQAIERAELAWEVLTKAPIAVEIYDADGLAEWLNPAMVALLGIPDAESAIGRFNILEDPFAIATGLKAQIEPAYAGEVVVRRGEEVNLGDAAGGWDIGERSAYFDAIYFPLLDEKGSVSRVAALVHDVTDTERIEQALVRAQHHEGLAVLAGSIAHDFNNLLSVIIGNAGLSLLEDLPEQARDCLGGISEAADTATKLTRQLLAYAGTGSFETESIDLDELVGAIAQLMAVSVSKKVDLAIELSGQAIPIAGDRTQLRQVLMNLIKNASDAIGDEPGTIRAATRLVEARRHELSNLAGGRQLGAGTYACIEVSDTGEGMQADVIERLFDPFFTTKGHGHGLGMAATLGILRRHGGDVGVYSVVGRGTTFRVYLPLSDAPPEMSSPIETARARGSKGLIMVVDDEPHLRRLARKVLEKQGHRVLDAADGRRCVELFAEHKDEVDLVLLDLSMPTQSGDEAFAELRAIRPDVKVVLLSGHQESELPAGLDSDQLFDFLHKPYEVEKLIDVVDRALAPTGASADE